MQKNNFQLDLTASCNISWGLFDHFQKMFSQYISDMFRVSLMKHMCEFVVVVVSCMLRWSTHIKIWIIQSCVKQFVSGWIFFRSPCTAQPWHIFLLGLLPFLQLRFPDFVHIASVIWVLLVFTSFIPYLVILVLFLVLVGVIYSQFSPSSVFF